MNLCIHGFTVLFKVKCNVLMLRQVGIYGTLTWSRMVSILTVHIFFSVMKKYEQPFFYAKKLRIIRGNIIK